MQMVVTQQFGENPIGGFDNEKLLPDLPDNLEHPAPVPGGCGDADRAVGKATASVSRRCCALSRTDSGHADARKRFSFRFSERFFIRADFFNRLFFYDFTLPQKAAAGRWAAAAGKVNSVCVIQCS